MASKLDQIQSYFLEDVPVKLINYKGLIMLDTYPAVADSIENFEIRDDDVWLCGFPKTGTTWTQELIWNIANDLDFERAVREILPERFHHLEFTYTTTIGWSSSKHPMGEKFPDRYTKSVEKAAKLPSPRFLKSHLPYHFLPRQLRTGEKKCKIIYVTRNPKDVCISLYHYYKQFSTYCSSFENFCNLFLDNKVRYAPFWDNVMGYWSKKQDDNILLLKYEDMKTNLPSIIRETAKFLGKILNDEQVKALEEHLSFQKMKDNPSVNMNFVVDFINDNKLLGGNLAARDEFIRKGETGQWKTEMSQDIIKRFDDWIVENLKDFEFKNDFIQYKN